MRERPCSALDSSFDSNVSSFAPSESLQTSSTDSMVWDQLRPFRVALINRIKEKPSEKKQLQRLHGILSGVRDDPNAVNVTTIAFDTIGMDEKWNEEYRLNEIIDIMMSFL